MIKGYFNSFFKYCIWLCLPFLVGSCFVKQFFHMKNVAECTFEVQELIPVSIGGINLKDRDLSDFTFMESARIAGLFASGNLPASFVLNLHVDNPNEKLAAMNKLDFIVYINDRELISGSNDSRVSIPGKGSAVVPVYLQTNLALVLKGEKLSALLDLALSAAGESNNPVVLKIKLKPYINVGKRIIEYPGYITISKNI